MGGPGGSLSALWGAGRLSPSSLPAPVSLAKLPFTGDGTCRRCALFGQRDGRGCFHWPVSAVTVHPHHLDDLADSVVLSGGRAWAFPVGFPHGLERNELRGSLNGTRCKCCCWVLAASRTTFQGRSPEGFLLHLSSPLARPSWRRAWESPRRRSAATPPFFHGLRRGRVCFPWESFFRLQDSRPLFCV